MERRLIYFFKNIQQTGLINSEFLNLLSDGRMVSKLALLDCSFSLFFFQSLICYRILI